MNRRLLGWLGLLVAVVLLDQISKQWIVDHLHWGDAIRVTDFFQIVLAYNPGAAFSFLADQSGWQRWFFTGLAIIVVTWLLVLIRRHANEYVLPMGLSLIAGGAIGNVIDRIQLGAVVDFLYFHWGSAGFPAFNLADSAITLGVILMLWDQLLCAKANSAAKES